MCFGQLSKFEGFFSISLLSLVQSNDAFLSFCISQLIGAIKLKRHCLRTNIKFFELDWLFADLRQWTFYRECFYFSSFLGPVQFTGFRRFHNSLETASTYLVREIHMLL
jgi:hypothetical protein